MSLDLASFTNDEPPTLIRRRPAAMERRAGARLPIEIDVHVEGGAHRFLATTADLSSGGVFVITQRTIPIGTPMMLTFALPNGVSVEVLSSVQWHHAEHGARPPGLGLAFFCLDPSVKAMLEAFCAAREPLYYAAH